MKKVAWGDGALPTPPTLGLEAPRHQPSARACVWAGSPAAGTGGPRPFSTELFPVPLKGAGPGLTGRNHVTAVTWGPDPTPHDLERPSRVLFTNGISEIVKSGLTGLTNGLNISFYWANSPL